MNAQPVCNSATGYCVPCAADSDCTATQDPSKPWIRPSCVLFADGGNPNTSPTLNTGGGLCGCSDTSQCNGGYACQNPGYYGTCQPTCNVTNGIDSCTPTSFYNGSCANGYTAYCNTYTGQCQSCLDDYDCTGLGCYQPICSDGGTCVGCFTGDDCLVTNVFNNTTCLAGNCTNYGCTDNSQCPTDGGYTCTTDPTGNANCIITCVLGDDAGLGTVSDAGNPCPTGTPFCVPNPYASDPTLGTCGNCLSAYDTTNCNADACGACGGYASCIWYAYACYLDYCNC